MAQIKVTGLLVVIILALLIYIVLNQITSGTDDGSLLNIETSEHISVWDGRTGDLYIIDREDYVMKIRETARELRYLKILDEPQKPGSSYNIYFQDAKGNRLTNISFAWPEDKVYINGQGYELVEEDKYLLYAYVADALYLKKWEELQE